METLRLYATRLFATSRLFSGAVDHVPCASLRLEPLEAFSTCTSRQLCRMSSIELYLRITVQLLHRLFVDVLRPKLGGELFKPCCKEACRRGFPAGHADATPNGDCHKSVS